MKELFRSRVEVSGPLYLPSFDGLRGYAVWMIVICHFTIAAMGDQGVLLDPNNLIGAAEVWNSYPEPVQALIGSGHFYVSALFVISGLVMFLPVAATGALGKTGFWIRRLFRIAPTYYVSFLLLVLLIPAVYNTATLSDYDSGGILAHLFFMQQEVSTPGFGVNGVVWILSIDLAFVIVLPLIAGWYYRHPFLGLALGLGIGLAWRELTVSDPRLYVQLPLFADEYALGMTGAIAVVRLMRDHEQLARRVSGPAVAVALVAMLAMMWVVGTTAHGLPMFLEDDAFSVGVPTAFTILAVSSVFFVARAQRALTNPMAKWMGDTSYSAYLYHMMLINLGLPLLNIDPVADWFAAAAVVFPATIVLAHFSFLLVERPARRLGSRLARRYTKASARGADPGAGRSHDRHRSHGDARPLKRGMIEAPTSS